jgi:hypothetical protein
MQPRERAVVNLLFTAKLARLPDNKNSEASRTNTTPVQHTSHPEWQLSKGPVCAGYQKSHAGQKQ